MADSVSLHITDEEKEKANSELETARQLFPDVNISVVGSEINLTGDVYDRIFKCKKWFEVKIGQQKRRRRSVQTADRYDETRSEQTADRYDETRRLQTADRYDEEDPYFTLRRHEYSKYVTYEKISVVVVEADLLDFDGKIDCFVDTTNNKLEHHSQVSKLLKQAGGEPYETACEQVRLEASNLKTTQCVATMAGNMRTKHIIHALCPVQADYGLIYSKKEMENDIFSTVFNCLKMAEDLQCQTIAFSFLCTGHGQLDIKVCSQQYAYAVLEFSRLRKNLFVVDAIYFIDKDQTKVDNVKEVFRQILPEKELQLLEVPRQDYSNYSMSRDQPSGDGVSEILEQSLHVEDFYTEISDAVDGQRTLQRRKHEDHEDNIETEHTNTVLEEENNGEGIPEDAVDENGGYEIPVTNRDPDTHAGDANAERIQHEHVYEKLNSREKMPEFRRRVGESDLVIEKCDIRNSTTVAIVCPETDGAERGGLLAASIKCTFRQSFDPKKLSKLQKNAIATTEYTTETGDTQYILHVRTPAWKAGTNEKEFENRLKAAMEMIFSKLKRHKKRNIRSIAIPLLGIDSVENDDIVGKCCKWQIEKIVEILQRKEEIAHLQEVQLINRCETIRNTLITEIKTFLPRELSASTLSR
ncbi:uncharacterized protein LOC123546412 [Mercenaria mercenaria]|uniref:uncharacterized protein LOC123546412 n=1 Tax=Mercenaria mercenaria TaxID=6596 RepID=UPI00234E8826|nr:uncharacterized protein LOC123546412 [Mercenaria mercenaria]